MVDKKEIKHGRIDQMDRSEVESRLKALIDKNQLAPVLMEKVVSEEEVPEELVEEEVEEEIDESELEEDWDDEEGEILDSEEHEDGEED